ncbi:uncharacterized lipoprotein YddW (UPF0748 family) [Dysgonomonas sp. PH5-45]|uniref:glycoside hydrolase family 10 protein n=1 Tax=unclassified Dysgonomonas TaxID=2630389 RepID=UPI002472FD82|nr:MULTISPECIES: family 10 glycosylhydrolase [unclassified Dysgonomonas]MDH6355357.1 uncharacterized lipoprotein YddW (UPF0748 family) [Dysgonomonas sp. PH5-45]MDH6388255.1 uncharacterized lipoprotein YddW (UPF0748 family) [Dysgonomonas sp. PH5-37]
MKNNLQIFLLLTVASLLIFSSCGPKKTTIHYADLKNPKREFRGAWLHTIGQGQYRNMTSAQMQQYFVDVLDKFQEVGINAVIFQVRPQADAFYKSDLEPWSRYLTGVQGKAPDSGFDPLTFLVNECHKRNMELHAWMNPYRVTSAEGQALAPSHIYNRYPERFVKYGTQTYFDPGIPENREFICQVVKDIIARYDVDAIHMDDYFYPYPIAGKSFPDDASFARYAPEQGFANNQRSDWRRNNVNVLIQEIKQTIMRNKPWVRFGISPFGIYRNKKSDATGSDTNGLQNYDDLYADIKLWVEKDWIDYNIPQVYWEIGHKAADYNTLVEWWAKNNFYKHLYIGQDVKRTMDAQTPSGNTQLADKFIKARSYPQVDGNCFWSGYVLLDNYKGVYGELVNNYHRYPALIPAYLHLHDKAPKDIKKIREEYTETNHMLVWDRNGNPADPVKAQYYVVYRFAKGEAKNTGNARNIVAITRDTRVVLPYEGGKNKYEYVVTSVDRFHNESKGKSKKVTL